MRTIGITVDNKDNSATSGTYEVAKAYCDAIIHAGATPILLPHHRASIATYLSICHGLIFTGGVDPDTRLFGQRLHAKARLMDPDRQRFETELLEAAAAKDVPTLGVCLGMQLMALVAGGTINQYMPDTMTAHATERHNHNNRHIIKLLCEDSVMGSKLGYETVVSSHRQCVSDAGRLRVTAVSDDGVIEAVDDPGRRFWLGVQWHPERGEEGALSRGLIQRFVAATHVEASD